MVCRGPPLQIGLLAEQCMDAAISVSRRAHRPSISSCRRRRCVEVSGLVHTVCTRNPS
jgi:hypothetical protein